MSKQVTVTYETVHRVNEYTLHSWHTYTWTQTFESFELVSVESTSQSSDGTEGYDKQTSGFTGEQLSHTPHTLIALTKHMLTFVEATGLD